MEDFTICPLCRLWKESLRVMPCCSFKFCDDCVWKSSGCVKCKTNLDFKSLPMYKPFDVLKRECLATCKFCGELYSTILLRHHECNCPKAPLSDIVKDLTPELPPNIPRNKLTEQDLREYHVRKNLLASYNKILPQPSSFESGFITHVIVDTDTISGIALRYGITTGDLRKANHLVGNNGDQALHQRTVLRIPATAPRTPESKEMDLASLNLLKRRLVARFARKTGAQIDEAEYYLEAHHYDLDLAFTEFQRDTQVPLPTPPKTISHRVPSKSLISINLNSKSNRATCCMFP